MTGWGEGPCPTRRHRQFPRPVASRGAQHPNRRRTDALTNTPVSPHGNRDMDPRRDGQRTRPVH